MSQFSGGVKGPNSQVDTTLSTVRTLNNGSYTTNWSQVDDIVWIDIIGQIDASHILNVSIEFNNSPQDPNVYLPGDNYITLSYSAQLAGSSYSHGLDIISFGLTVQGKWARLVITHIAGSGTIKVSVVRKNVTTTAPEIPIATNLSSDFRAAITKSVGTGQQPDGDFVNIPADGIAITKFDGYGLDAQGDPILFTTDYTTDTFTATSHGLLDGYAVILETGGTLPAPLDNKTIYFIRDATDNTFKLADFVDDDAINITDNGTGNSFVRTRDYYVSDFIDTDQWRTIEVVSNADAYGCIYLEFTDDVQATTPKARIYPTILELSQEFINSDGGTFLEHVRLDGFRLRYINGPNKASYVNIWATLRVVPIGNIHGNLIMPLSDTNTASLTRSVIVGQQDDSSGVYDNVNVHKDSTGTSQIMARGHRISQVLGRSHVDFNLVGQTADTLGYTIASGKRLQVTSFIITVSNTDVLAAGQLLIRDGTSTSGSVKIPLII